MEITPKTPWRKEHGDRRKKDGSSADRKLAADIIKVNRATDSNIRKIEKETEHNSFVVAVCILTAIVLMITFTQKAHAYTESQAVMAVIGEAEGEGYQGMLAVACAIRNRGSLHGVYGIHAYRVVHHKYSNTTLDKALMAWHESTHKDITNGATGWGNATDVEKFKHSTWFPSVYFTAHIGRQWFYATE